MNEGSEVFPMSRSASTSSVLTAKIAPRSSIYTSTDAFNNTALSPDEAKSVKVSSLAQSFIWRWMFTFVDEDDDRDVRSVKIALTFLDAGTIICGLAWGIMYAVMYNDYRTACVIWSFCVLSAISGIHLASTRTTMIAAPMFVFGISSIPTIISFTRGGIEHSGVVILWSIILAPIASLLLLLSRRMAWGLWAAIALVVLFIASMEYADEDGDGAWNIIESENARDDTRFLHGWYALNVICACGLGFAAMDYFWSRWRCERARSEQLLHTVYPKDVLRELQKRQDSRAPYAVKYDKLAVLFLDICQFTSWASQLDCEDMVASMSEFVTCVNENARKWGVELVKNIGDASLIIAGRPAADETFKELCLTGENLETSYGIVNDCSPQDKRAKRTLKNLQKQIAARDREQKKLRSPNQTLVTPTGKCDIDEKFVCMEDPYTRLAKFAIDIIESTRTRDFNGHTFSIRVGISVGETIAGVIGTGSGVVGGGAFDVFGDNVNRAARLESAGTPGHVHCSKEFGEMINNDDGYFDIQPKGSVNVKGIEKAIDTVYIAKSQQE